MFCYPGPMREGVDIMPRPTTTERGYGWEHQQARARALQQLKAKPGQPCPFCQHGMTVAMALDYDHYPPLAHGPTPTPRRRRLAHSTCNRRAGQAIAAARRRARKRAAPTVNSRRW